MNPKKWTPIEVEEQTVYRLQKALGISPLLCRLLVQRGICDFDSAKRFFRPHLHMLEDPFLMKDMDLAVERLDQALRDGENILLYGDYDVDGTTCVSMLYSFLSEQGATLYYYIPDRYKEGYGLSEAGVRFAQEKSCSLIITMDCGIKAFEELAFAKKMGIDCIVCDHHQPDDRLPEAVAILDPKRQDCLYPYKELSGCGVVFKLIQAYAQMKDIPFETIENLLDFVAVSTCCDIVDLTGENRVMAYFGIWHLNKSPRLGFKALLKETNRQYPYDVNDIVFGLGPMINAAGRLGDAKKAVQLLLSNEPLVAKDSAQFLSNQNKKRRELDGSILKEAEMMIAKDQSDKNSFVLFNSDWHKGVLGISASRIVEKYHRPTVVLTQTGDMAVGSARSIQGFDLYGALLRCAHLFENFGGHSHAAGLTLKLDRLQAFETLFESLSKESIKEDDKQAVLSIAATIVLEDITPKFYRILKQFAPFGPKNRRPIFEVKGLKDTGRSRLLKNNHLKLELRSKEGTVYKGIAFNLGHHYEYVQKKRPLDVAFVLEENHWKGRTTLELMVKDIRIATSVE